MGAVGTLIDVTVGLWAAGTLWNIFEDSITYYFSPYIISATNAYYLGSDLFWDMIPYILWFSGIITLVFAGLAYRSGSGVSE